MTATPASQPTALRHVLHACLGSLIAALGLLVSRGTLLPTLGVLAALAFVLEALRFARPDLNGWLVGRFAPLVKTHERQAVSGATYLVLSALMVFAVFDARIAVLAVAYTAWGDPLASVVGERAGHWRWKGKSIEGAFVFLVGATVAGLLLAPLGANIALSARLLGAAVAAGIEILPIRLDDNISVPIGSATAMTLVVALESAV
ncbi:MAG: hypothetical protein Q7T26_11520 [Dehalococcoidia bacterium]|nr:hypothetical protein [Dehalococcoidia bacterium]